MCRLVFQSEMSMFAMIDVDLIMLIKESLLLHRSVNMSSACFQHLEIDEDSLTITLPSHKGDHQGKRIIGRHIYANPLQPAVCPILSLGLYFCAYPEVDATHIFPGGRQVFTKCEKHHVY